MKLNCLKGFLVSYTCSKKFFIYVRHQAKSNFTIVRNKLKTIPSCIPVLEISLSKLIGNFINISTYTFRLSIELSRSFLVLTLDNQRLHRHIHRRVQYECWEFPSVRQRPECQVAMDDCFVGSTELQHGLDLHHDIGRRLHDLFCFKQKVNISFRSQP